MYTLNNKIKLQRLEKLSIKSWSDEQEAHLIPLLSTRIMCGLFGICEDHTEKYLSLDSRFIKNKAASFIFRLEGNSMEPVIFENEYILVDRSIDEFMNRIVVADYQGERMCKYLTKISGRQVLHSFNPKVKDIIISDQNELSIFGVATVSFKKLNFLKDDKCIQLLL